MTSNQATNAPRPPSLPPMRSFEIHRMGVSIIVHAHEISFTPHGALCFVVYTDDNGEVFSQMPRVFNVGAWDDVEEILRTGSLLVH